METNDIILEAPISIFKDEHKKTSMATWFKDLANGFGCDKATVVFLEDKAKLTACFMDAGKAGQFAGHFRNQGFPVPIVNSKQTVH